jgi:hypothetical protein
MTTDICRLRNINFPVLKHPQIGYADQKGIQVLGVNLATAGIIYYSLHPGMLVCYIKGKFVGETRDVSQLIKDVLPHINESNFAHIDWILTKDCPTYDNFKEASDVKSFMIEKGNFKRPQQEIQLRINIF